MSHELTASGVEHVVLERGRIANGWRSRWDSLCLVTPNWSVRLPGGHYDGDDPDGFMSRDEIVDYLEHYADSFSAPVWQGVAVRSLAQGTDGFELDTSEGLMRADNVVVTTGAYQRSYRPPAASALPARLHLLDASDYRGPAQLPPGGVLVVGGGQSGCQIAEELRREGRDVVVAASRVPWVPRKIGGRDIVRWHEDTGWFERPRESLGSPAARIAGNQQLGPGHDLNYRTLRALGVTLVGHLSGVGDGRIAFASDLAECVAYGDARYDDLRERVRDHCAKNGTAVPQMPDPEPFDAAARDSMPVDAFGAVIFACGFRPEYARWVAVPGAFDPLGFPVERDGASIAAPGLYFCGVHFMRKRKSSLLLGIGEDAALVATAIARRRVVA